MELTQLNTYIGNVVTFDVGLNYELAIQKQQVSAYQREWLWYITVIPYPFVVSLICTPSAIAGPWALGVHIRQQTTRVHGITITCTHLHM